jgi:hypothetical protein
MRSRSRSTRPQPNHRTSLLPGPILGLVHEHSSNSLPPAAPVDHQSANHDEWFCLDVFKNYRVQPSSCAPIDFGDEKLLFGPCKDARQPWSERRRCDVVPQLRRQACDVVHVRLASRSYANCHGYHPCAFGSHRIILSSPRAVVQESLPSLRNGMVRNKRSIEVHIHRHKDEHDARAHVSGAESRSRTICVARPARAPTIGRALHYPRQDSH